MERRRILAKSGIRTSTRKTTAPVSCISKSLYDEPPQSGFFPLKLLLTFVHFAIITISKFRLGQFFITVFDYYVQKLEKTLEFCVPRKEAEMPESYKKAIADRPLSWVLFLAALVSLRFLRFWLSVISIILGNGEVTAKQMLMVVVSFRRYYRSVRHYAVVKYSEDNLRLKEFRCKRSLFWRFLYGSYEAVFMTNPPVKVHDAPCKNNNNGDVQEVPSNKTSTGAVEKSSLNEIECSYTSDEDLQTTDLLDKYANRGDSYAKDPDFEPGEEPSSEDISSDVDTEEEKTESQKKLNGHEGDNSEDEIAIINRSSGGYSSDVDSTRKRKDEIMIDELKNLENQLVMNIMKHFKDNFIYSPSILPPELQDETFYSPIGSPPEKGYNSEPEFTETKKDELEPQNGTTLQSLLISSSEEKALD